MKFEVRELNEIHDGWDAFVRFHPDATNYHQWQWKKVVEESFRHNTHYLYASDEEGNVRGVLPLVHMKSRLFGSFLISLPFFNYGGVLTDSEGAEEALLDEARKVMARADAGHIELRHMGREIESLPSKLHKVTMILPLEADEEIQWKGFNAKLRNQIRKAVKSGLSVSSGGVELLDGFYDVFARNMRDLGTPVYGKEFFANILQALPSTTGIFTVSNEGGVIAAGLALWFRETMEIPWASSIREYNALCPNNLLYWEAIRFAIRNGLTRFDFGRSTPGEGTYRFKEQWGAKPLQLFWQYLLKEGEALPELNPKNPKYRLAIRIWRRLPLVLTRIVGPRIVRNIP